MSKSALSCFCSAAALAGAVSAQPLWRPKPFPLPSWQWQIGEVPDTNALLGVDMYDVDLFDTPAETIGAMKARGIAVVCYFSAGTYEGHRPDWRRFFPFITGDDYQGSEKPFLGKMADWNERWLDVRDTALLKPIMTARLALAKEKGCDAVEPDNMDSYANLGEVKPTGPYTAAHQLAYNRAIARWAHEAGLSVGLKNDVDQLDDLVDIYDWALNEECFQYDECAGYAAFTEAGKAVFGVEYQGDTADFCPRARAMDLAWLFKKRDLLAYRQSCNEGRSLGVHRPPAVAAGRNEAHRLRDALGRRNRRAGSGTRGGSAGRSVRLFAEPASSPSSP